MSTTRQGTIYAYTTLLACGIVCGLIGCAYYLVHHAEPCETCGVMVERESLVSAGAGEHCKFCAPTVKHAALVEESVAAITEQIKQGRADLEAWGIVNGHQGGNRHE